MNFPISPELLENIGFITDQGEEYLVLTPAGGTNEVKTTAHNTNPSGNSTSPIANITIPSANITNTISNAGTNAITTNNNSLASENYDKKILANRRAQQKHKLKVWH